MNTTPLSTRTNNGSRQFAQLPEACTWDEFRQHIARMPGAAVADYIGDAVTETWLDFSLHGHVFTVISQYGAFWFFVRDASCPNEILTAVVKHGESLLTK